MLRSGLLICFVILVESSIAQVIDDSTKQVPLVNRISVGTELFIDNTKVMEALISQFQMDNVNDLFVSLTYSFGVVFPNTDHTYIGMHLIHLRSQTTTKYINQLERTFYMSGYGYGLYIENEVIREKALSLIFGANFTRNYLFMNLTDRNFASSPPVGFSNSKNLNIEYRSNSVRPYVILGYSFRKNGSSRLQLGIVMSSQIILPKAIWKLSKDAIYDEWVYRDSNVAVDFPSLGRNTIAGSIFFAIRLN
jgi:hypothetical protein